MLVTATLSEAVPASVVMGLVAVEYVVPAVGAVMVAVGAVVSA
jgi:hypothetical protein